MAFKPNFRKAAYRHLEAAATLAQGTRRDVAGYLYGIAAECAIKVMMSLTGVRDNDAFYSHFPELRTLLRDAIQGRNARTLSTFINDDSFMNNWDIKMRYADSGQIRDEWVQAWEGHARRAVSAMET